VRLPLGRRGKRTALRAFIKKYAPADEGVEKEIENLWDATAVIRRAEEIA
jgi:hypothetical protein